MRGKCLLLATQLLSQNFFQVKLIQPGLEFSTAGLASPQVFIFTGNIYLWQEEVFVFGAGRWRRQKVSVPHTYIKKIW